MGKNMLSQDIHNLHTKPNILNEMNTDTSLFLNQEFILWDFEQRLLLLKKPWLSLWDNPTRHWWWVRLMKEMMVWANTLISFLQRGRDIDVVICFCLVDKWHVLSHGNLVTFNYLPIKFMQKQLVLEES